MDSKNYIIAEIDIKEKNINKDIKIINSYEHYIKSSPFPELFDKENIEQNEIKIEDNCEIMINDDIIPFSYSHVFNQPGKYKITYKFKKNLKRADYLFYECDLISFLDLSNFNTEDVTDMKNMFSNCYSLKEINLSNLNTKKVTNMAGMFAECNSLKELNLSSFNTENITNMAGMFSNCVSLINLDLSNFNTEKVDYMPFIFSECHSLKNLILSNLDTKQ